MGNHDPRFGVGAVTSGVVARFTGFGAYVDLDGRAGLLLLPDMSYGRVRHPRDLFEVGQSIRVEIRGVNPENGILLLGHKQLWPDPWLQVAQKYPVGATVTGRVTAVPDYGAFVELEHGVEGLVHISELSVDGAPPEGLTRAGARLTAVVLSIDVEARRMTLSAMRVPRGPPSGAQ